MNTPARINQPKLKRIALVFGSTLFLLTAGSVWAQSSGTTSSPAIKPDQGNLRAFIELARADLRTQKSIILAQNMELTEAEGAEFWPLQRDYQHELTRLDDQRLANLQDYSTNYESMTDEKAADLVKRSFDLEEKRTELKRKYFKKMIKVMPARKAARFFQLDNQINMAVELQVAASLPLIK